MVVAAMLGLACGYEDRPPPIYEPTTTSVEFKIEQLGCVPTCQLARFDVFVHRQLSPGSLERCAVYSSTSTKGLISPRVALAPGTRIFAGVAAYCQARGARECCLAVEMCKQGSDVDACHLAERICPRDEVNLLDPRGLARWFDRMCLIRTSCPACSVRREATISAGDDVVLDLARGASTCAPYPVKLRCPDTAL